MNRTYIILIVAVVAIVAIIATVIALAPNSKAEQAILSQKPVEQKNLISDIGGLIGSIYGK